MKRETADEMLDLLYRLLPYIQSLESDQTYAPGTIKRLRVEMQAVIARAENKPQVTARARGRSFTSIHDAIAHATGDSNWNRKAT